MKLFDFVSKNDSVIILNIFIGNDAKGIDMEKNCRSILSIA